VCANSNFAHKALHALPDWFGLGFGFRRFFLGHPVGRVDIRHGKSLGRDVGGRFRVKLCSEYICLAEGWGGGGLTLIR
jgi:hypothetical protein